MSGRVIVVGSINTDLVVRAKTLPRPGETIIGEGFAIAGGGKGANAAVAAARMGARVTMIARVGDDDFGRARLADLAADGIDVAGVRQLANTASGVALITVDAHGENTIVVASGANMLLSLDALDSLAFGPDDVLMTQIEVPFATTEAALRLARDAGATTVLNTAPYNPDCAAMLPLVDVLIANEIEAADLIGWSAVTAENAAEAIGTILGRGPRAVALTLGAHGAVVGRAGESHHLPAPQVTVIDTTAAGDAFCGALASGLAAGDDLFAAAARAVIAGSLAVTKPGAQPSLPRREEVDAFVERGA
ncbi:MAG: ribokinase [Chloroflexia bacterium]